VKRYQVIQAVGDSAQAAIETKCRLNAAHESFHPTHVPAITGALGLISPKPHDRGDRIQQYAAGSQRASPRSSRSQRPKQPKPRPSLPDALHFTGASCFIRLPYVESQAVSQPKLIERV